MIEVGKYNKLVVSKERDFGFFLKDEEEKKYYFQNHY